MTSPLQVVSLAVTNDGETARFCLSPGVNHKRVSAVMSVVPQEQSLHGEIPVQIVERVTQRSQLPV